MTFIGVVLKLTLTLGIGRSQNMEDIDFYDVTSLYPWFNKTGKIP